MDRSLPMRGTKTPPPHRRIISESSRFCLAARAVTLLFLWIALTFRTSLQLHPSNHTRLRSGGLPFVFTAEFDPDAVVAFYDDSHEAEVIVDLRGFRLRPVFV